MAQSNQQNQQKPNTQQQAGQQNAGMGGQQADPKADPQAANTDETVQAEDRARSMVSGSGNTLGDGMTAGGGDRVEERKVFQAEGGETDASQAGGDRRYGGKDGKTANEEKGGEGDEDSASA
ncbi:hypothetical protein L602_001200000310 [Cupriavidus gilardii J11]|uniref:Uncharacterized protein n=1 Tax=Cupriavidus gilardii J11 TaxID=936133 RepID=A0A562BT34_9BURK|nr:hypothetical protein [Cupriavidus gilardii]TWG88438.1 hypothetical protein L602_001200000310 [Cupriavidus gilardii J11]